MTDAATLFHEQDRAVALQIAGLTYGQIAKEMGLTLSAVKRRLTAARKRERLDPLIAQKLAERGVTDLAGLHSGWLMDRDEHGAGQSLYFYLGPDGPISPEEHAEMLAAAFANVPPAPQIKAPEHVAKGKVAFFPVSDFHLGAVITEQEAEAAYNRAIAVARLRSGFSLSHAAIPPAETAIILYNGDTTHANDFKDRTPRSGHVLKVEGSHHSNVTLACECLIWQVDMALERHGEVIVSVRRGNHDPSTPTALILGLKGRYANEPRVTIQDDENDYFLFQRGKLFICAHHGDGQKPEKMALNIPHKFRREWGISDHHYFFTGHLHHTRSDTFGGLYWKQLPALTVLDQHAQQMGYAETGGMLAMLFDTASGACSEFTTRL